MDQEPVYTKTCPYCGEEIMASAIKCKHCGESLDGYDPNARRQAPAPAPTPAPVPTVVQSTPSNGMGAAGMVLSIIALCLCWFPLIGWILCFLGVLFSIIGLFRSPRGKAVAGLVIGLIASIVAVVIVTVAYNGLTGDLYYM